MTNNQESNQSKNKEENMTLNFEAEPEKKLLATPPINLLIIGNKVLIQGKEKFVKELSKSKSALYILFEIMLKNYPVLEGIKSLTAFKVFASEFNKKDIRLYTISLMSQDSKLICVLPDINQTIVPFDLISVNLSEKTALVNIEKIPLIINVLLSDDGLDMVSNIEGDDELIIEASNVDHTWLSQFKIYGNKLESVAKGKYTAILNGLKTETHNTPMLDLTNSKGENFKNIIANKQLTMLLKDGKEHKIVIGDTITTKAKNGQSYTRVELYEL